MEYGSSTPLFDTGADDPHPPDNMRQLDVKPYSIEAVALFHAHGGSTVRLPALLDTGIGPSG